VVLEGVRLRNEASAALSCGTAEVDERHLEVLGSAPRRAPFPRRDRLPPGPGPAAGGLLLLFQPQSAVPCGDQPAFEQELADAAGTLANERAMGRQRIGDAHCHPPGLNPAAP